MRLLIVSAVLFLASCAGTPRETAAADKPGCFTVTRMQTASRIKAPSNGVQTIECPRRGQISAR